MQSGFTTGEEKKWSHFEAGGKIKIPKIAATFLSFVDVGLRDLERSFDFAGEANRPIAYYVIHLLHTQRNRKTKKNETRITKQHQFSFGGGGINRESSVI